MNGKQKTQQKLFFLWGGGGGGGGGKGNMKLRRDCEVQETQAGVRCPTSEQSCPTSLEAETTEQNKTVSKPTLTDMVKGHLPISLTVQKKKDAGTAET